MNFKTIWTAILALVVLLGISASAPPASAEIVPGVTTYWGVTGMATGTTTDSIDSEVWAIEQIGNRIYVGGKFTHVTNGAIDSPQPYIAAFDSVTGVWIDSWTPSFNGPVYALKASPDGSRLFVGGEFSEYEGTNVKGLAALNPQTGAIDWSFAARVSGGSSPSVKALDIEGTWLYVAGEFDFLKSNGIGPGLSNVGRVSYVSGEVDSFWTPGVSGGSVWGVDASPTSSNIYLAGRFNSVDNAPNTQGFAAVDEAGAVVTTGFQKNTANANYMQDVETVNGLVFVGGSQHILSVYNETDWSLLVSHHTNGDYQAMSMFRDANYGGTKAVRSDGFWNMSSVNVGDNRVSSLQIADGYTATVCTGTNGGGTCTALNGFHPTLPADLDDAISSITLVRDEVGPDGRGGDYQAIEVVGDRVYASCHCWGDHYSDNSIRNWDLYETPKGTWADAQWVHAYSATTGEHVESFKSGITNSGTGPWAIHGATNGCLWVGGGVTGSGGQPANGFVRLCDGELDTNSPTAVTGLTVTGETSESVDLTWTAATDDVAITEYRIYDNSSDAVITSSTSTDATVSNLAPGVAHSFYVKARDAAGNEGARSNIVTVTLGAVGGPLTCTASNEGTAASLTWDPVENALDYRVSRSIDGSTFWWRGVPSDPTFTDTLRNSGIHQYQIQARGSNLNWSTPTPCAPELDPTSGLLPALPPATCTAAIVAEGSALISWDASENAVLYRMLRSVDGSPLFWRGSTAATSMPDSLRSSGVHTYEVQAKGTDGIWSASTVCDPPLDTTTPSAAPVATCSASNVGTDATINWDSSEHAVDYRVYRSIDGGVDYWRFITGQLGFTDILRSSGVHTYSVQARGADGVWSASTICADPLDPTSGLLGAEPVTTCTLTTNGLAATISWPPATNASGYRVDRSVNGNAFFWRGVTTDVLFNDTLRDTTMVHIYQVRARGEDGIWSSPTQCEPAP